jgi:hypothetical protein
MGWLQGEALPNITETTTEVQTTPDYYTDYLTGLSKAGQSALYSTMPTDTTAGVLKTGKELVAGMDPMQTLGYGGLQDAATGYRGTLDDAIRTAGIPAGGLQSSRITGLMDPYTQQVVNEMGRLSQQNVQQQLLPTMKAGFVGRGDLGSRRYAGALGQSMADVQSNLTGQQYGALSKGYSDAMKAALDELRIQNEAAKTQGQLAETQQELGLAGQQALIKGGAEKQAYQQSLLDAPLRYAKESADVMRGFQVPVSESSTFTGPKAGVYSKSGLEQIMGALSVLGGIRPNDAKGQSVLGQILDKVSKLPNTGTIDWSSIFDVDFGDWDDVTGEDDTVINPVDPATGEEIVG